MTNAAHFLAGHGHLPGGARRAGFEADHALLYVARARVGRGLHVGKYNAAWDAASIPYGGAEVWAKDYEVWVGFGVGVSGGAWERTTSTAHAVVCGSDDDGAPLYAARSYFQGGLVLGKWRQSWTAASMPYGGGEHWVEEFEVLTDAVDLEGDPAFNWLDT